MKRTIKCLISEESYSLLEEDRVIFSINKLDLQFDLRQFYDAFFANEQDYSAIEFEDSVTADSNAKRIFGCAKQLLEDVVKQLKEKLSESSDVD